MMPRLLCVYGDLTPEILERIKIAKGKTGVKFQCVIRQAVPGSPGRILALSREPNWICDYALIHDTTNQAAFDAAVAWALSDKEDSRANTVLDSLRRIFGPGVTEIEAQNVASVVFS